MGPGEERRQPFRHKKHLPLPTPQELTFAQQLLLSFIWELKMLLIIWAVTTGDGNVGKGQLR